MWTRLQDCIRGVGAGEPNELPNEHDDEAIYLSQQRTCHVVPSSCTTCPTEVKGSVFGNNGAIDLGSKIIFSRSNIERSPAVCTKAVCLCHHECVHE
jgi:hypothetical protein